MKHLFSLDDLIVALNEFYVVYGDPELVVVGSMSVLGLLRSKPLDAEVRLSVDIDLYPKNTLVEGVTTNFNFGRNSDFEVKYGFTIDGVDSSITDDTPPGWEQRTIPITTDQGVTGYCLAPIDTAFNKVLAGREKDVEHIRLFLKHDLIREGELRSALEKHSPDLKRSLEVLELILKDRSG